MVLHGYLAFIALAFRPALWTLLLGLRIASLRAVSVMLALLFLGAPALAGTIALAFRAIITPCAVAIVTTVTRVIGFARLALFVHRYLKRFNHIGALRLTSRRLRRRRQYGESQH
jgi:hypothetical protein